MILGIDPGNKGFICFIIDSIHWIPLDKSSSYILRQLQRYEIEKAYIEDVHSIYGMSAKSNFSFGFNVGKVHTIIEALDIPIELVQPKKWQKYLGVTTKGKAIKQEVGQLVRDIYPHADIFGKRGGLLDGKADSLAILHYGLNNAETE